MAEPRLIRDYLAALDERLPAAIVEELADGLEETYRRHLAAGLETQAAARAALAEFGAPGTIATAFTDTAPARRAARTLLRAGPVVGGCWAAALVDARAWDWSVPAPIPLALAVTLAVVIALLLRAAFCRRYGAARRAAGAALLGVVVLDVALSSMLALPGPTRGWLLTLAAGLSLARAGFATRALWRIRAS